MKLISGKLRRSLDHPKAEILTIVASYLKSLWFCSRSWTSVRSSQFSPLLDGGTCHIDTKSALILPVDFELGFKISLRSFALSFWMSFIDENSM